MSKALRLSEKWFRRGLWLVAILFAGFLIGLGSNIVDDLPQVETPLSLDDFLDKEQAERLRLQLKELEKTGETTRQAAEQARLQYEKAKNNTQAERELFENWLAARSVTQRSDNDPAVMERTRALDTIKADEGRMRQALESQQQALLDTQHYAQQLRNDLNNLEEPAREQLQQAYRSLELRVFVYRLLLTLPLLILAGWLFAKKRKSAYWPFVWGFIYFALFTFFFELVPYLPSYGGYVRSGVGIVITVLVGRWSILALQRYRERQAQVEAQPEQQRRQALSYDAALVHLSKNVCPGCERKVKLDDGVTDFCPHCGIGLYVPCNKCGSRKSAFTRFCFHCGSQQE